MDKFNKLFAMLHTPTCTPIAIGVDYEKSLKTCLMLFKKNHGEVRRTDKTDTEV